MKNTKKILLCCLCVVAIVAASVLGTLAYLTDKDEAVNTFTVGNVDITVDESDVTPEGETIPGAERVQENSYHLLPGQTYAKDPTMTVEGGSEDSYVRMILTIHNHSAVQAIVDNERHGLTDYADLLGGKNFDVWEYIDFTVDSEANTISFEFRYKDIVPNSKEDQVLEPLFTELIVPPTLTNDELIALYDGNQISIDDFKMTVTGHAIQATGFDNADAAWAAFDAQMALEDTQA